MTRALLILSDAVEATANLLGALVALALLGFVGVLLLSECWREILRPRLLDLRFYLVTQARNVARIITRKENP